MLVLGASGAGGGCGRMLLGRLPVDMPPDGGAASPDGGAAPPDGGADLAADVSARADAPTPTPDAPQVCTADGWCWTHPLPTSDRFVNAFAVGPDDLWFIGASGAIVRFTAGVWSAIPSPTDALSTIWASASDDVWVGGAAGPFHWDGRSWTQVPPPTSPGARAVNAIWGCAPNDVWAMGVVATHWDGHQLSFVDMPATAGGFRTVWGSACNDVWAGFLDDGLGSGRIAHWNGSAWATTESRPAEQITGTGADDVWSLAQGQLFQWSGLGAGTLRDGHTLSLFSLGPAAVGSLNDNRTISVFARDGTSALSAPAPDAVSALWGRAARDIWGFGARGAASHWNGESWTPQLPGWALSGDDAVRVTGSGPGDLWAVAGSTLLHGDGATWSAALTSQQVGGRIFDLWARASDDVWVLGGDALIHRWNGRTWSTIDPPPRGNSTLEMRAISGTGPDDVWVLRGRNSVLHWDGATWLGRQPLVDNLVDIWSPGPNEVWVVGDGLARWSGTGWSAPRIPFMVSNAPFTAVSGSGPTDVWILAGGYALKVSDDYWDLNVAVSSDWRAASLSPTSTGGVWVLFQDGAVASRLYHMTSIDPYEHSPALLAPAGLNDLWAAPDGTLWAAGSGGALIRKRPAP
ncbi:MAG TPA: hypothetical protein VFH68_04775 [Polyangia bacterium]|nr:hypothetical protein [Polyangia bacterium]